MPATRRAPVALLLSAVLAAPAWAQRIADPELYAKSLEAAHQALEMYGEYEDRAESRRVLDIGYRLAQENTFQDFPFTFYLIDMPVPNAFALPGGQVFVTRGMLEIGLSDDMLAGLLGHEIGHVAERHGLRMQKRATLLNVLSQALLIGVLVNETHRDSRQSSPYPDPYAGSGSASRIQGAAAAGAVASELLLRSYSREFEDEADLEGQRMAAAAGFDPDGTRQLMVKMSAQMPQETTYGYWQTHPFFEERVQHAGVRRELMTVVPAKSADGYRRVTQRVLLDYAAGDTTLASFVEDSALAVWPQGPDAERLRLTRLHAARDAELEHAALAQDYGRLLDLYRSHADAVRELTPDSPLLPTLAAEVSELEGKRDAIYPEALRVLDGGVYETGFLETFLSNFPESPQGARVDLALGEAYSRRGQQAEAVDHFLDTLKRAPDEATAAKARRGLNSLASSLTRLDALQTLALHEDSEISQRAAQRLAERVAKFTELADGAAYLESYPRGEHAEAVSARLNRLADNAYGEVVLYQTVGDDAKAVEGIREILQYAPLSPAAEKLRSSMVVES